MRSLNFVFRAILFSFVAFLYGCSTVITQTPFLEKRYIKETVPPRTADTHSNIYSGVAADFNLFKDAAFSNTNDGGGGYGQGLVFVGVYVLIDLPLSFVADTVLLPFTIYKQSKRGNFYTCFQARKCQRFKR